MTVSTCPRVLCMARTDRGVQDQCGPGGCTRVYQGGYTGGVLPSQHAAQGSPHIQRSGPRKPRGLEWVGYGDWTRVPGYGGRGRVFPTLRARSVPCRALPGNTLGIAHLRPIRRDLGQYSVKLVKTAMCHRNMSKRPVIVPISKTGSRIHLLRFSDFQFR